MIHLQSILIIYICVQIMSKYVYGGFFNVKKCKNRGSLSKRDHGDFIRGHYSDEFWEVVEGRRMPSLRFDHSVGRYVSTGRRTGGEVGVASGEGRCRNGRSLRLETPRDTIRTETGK